MKLRAVIRVAENGMCHIFYAFAIVKDKMINWKKKCIWCWWKEAIKRRFDSRGGTLDTPDMGEHFLIIMGAFE
uniref:AlNc14C31G2867 protein n=1 Tax=Albugo laibachii Nc14 TaxID=890382 RepID=F0W7R3_9STRA|nr:AlNc14C31G2867 [Albugo laibachii Nc14]|eukprot:CCA17165.1 AlNc14C31G2867 [Albugo laibachii Nc14]